MVTAQPLPATKQKENIKKPNPNTMRTLHLPAFEQRKEEVVGGREGALPFWGWERWPAYASEMNVCLLGDTVTLLTITSTVLINGSLELQLRQIVSLQWLILHFLCRRKGRPCLTKKFMFMCLSFFQKNSGFSNKNMFLRKRVAKKGVFEDAETLQTSGFKRDFGSFPPKAKSKS